jgi:heavy metal sensor kinase
MNFWHSIKFRFVVWYLVVLGVLLGLFGVVLYFRLSDSLHRDLDASLRTRADQLSLRSILLTIRQGQFEEELGEVIVLYFRSDAGDDNFLYLSSPRDLGLPVGTDLLKQVLTGQSQFATMKTSDGRELRVFLEPVLPGVPVLSSDDSVPAAPSVSPPSTSPSSPSVSPSPPVVIEFQPGVLLVGRPTGPVADALSGLFRTLAIIVPVTLAVAAVGGLFLAQRALKPVDEITEKARSIEEHDLSQRLPVKTRDELGKLAATLNEMIERLEKAFQRQQQFTSDASHELRAPLAIIEAESTLALGKGRTADEYRGSLETISQETRHMSHIIEQLLTLARADAGKEKLSLGPVNLGALITELSSDVEILCRDKGLEFQMGEMADLTTSGDETRLRRLFLNLLDNAIRYTPSGGKVTVSLGREGDMAVVAVSDTGIGILTEHQAHIFDRFYRVDKARSRSEGGSGLGLAIAKTIAEAHGGRIGVESEPGKGSTFRVWLPLLE